MPERRGASFAFPRAFRLTKTDEYSSVFGFRKALRSSHFLLHYRPKTAVGARLGTVVAKRLLKRSVDRNLVRRLAKESFRMMRDGLPACDFILRLASRPKLLERRGLAGEMRSLLKKSMTIRHEFDESDEVA